ncbi:ureidoglycolate lyase, partial [Sinorhizobium fredii]
APGQGVNIARNVWHGILTPLNGVSDFVVVDRGGEGCNLEEHFFDMPYRVEYA